MRLYPVKFILLKADNFDTLVLGRLVVMNAKEATQLIKKSKGVFAYVQISDNTGARVRISKADAIFLISQENSNCNDLRVSKEESPDGGYYALIN